MTGEAEGVSGCFVQAATSTIQLGLYLIVILCPFKEPMSLPMHGLQSSLEICYTASKATTL